MGWLRFFSLDADKLSIFSGLHLICILKALRIYESIFVLLLSQTTAVGRISDVAYYTHCRLVSFLYGVKAEWD